MAFGPFVLGPFGLIALIVGPIVLVIFKLVNNKYGSNHLQTIPGPLIASCTGYWRAYMVSKGQAEKEYIALHRRHGPLVRTAPNAISVADPDEIPRIYGQNHKFEKSGFYPLQSITWKKKPAFNLFSTPSPDEHRRLSRQVGSAYSLTSILQSEPAIDSCINLFTAQLRQRSTNRQPLDLGAWLQYLTFDAIGEITFAQKFGFLAQGADIDGIIASIRSQAAYSAVIGQVPSWHAWLLGNPLLSKLMAPLEDWNATLRFCVKAMHARMRIANGEITPSPSASDSASGGGVDMASKWSAVPASSPHKMDERALFVALSANIFAGSDTIAIALKATFYHLTRNPRTLALLASEVRAADAAGVLSTPIQHAEAQTYLPYTRAAIKEAQRLHPSFGLPFERVVPAGGAAICGAFVPAGTVVGVSPWVLNRDASVFEEPDAFVPERWLAGTAAERARREAVLAFGFGHGVRACAGRNIALVEMGKIVPEVVRRFDIEGLDGREWETSNYWFVHQGPLRCVVTPV